MLIVNSRQISRGLMHHAAVAKTEMKVVSDNNMVKNLDPEQFSRLDQPLRQMDVLPARPGVAARMIVNENDGRS